VQRSPPVPARRFPARDAAHAVRYRQTSLGCTCSLFSGHLHLRFRSNLASTSTSRRVLQQRRRLVWLLIDRLPGAGGAKSNGMPRPTCHPAKAKRLASHFCTSQLSGLCKRRICVTTAVQCCQADETLSCSAENVASPNIPVSR
jgi:hypothetical protein